MMLMAFLEPEARERIARIALVKPDKARLVEENVLRTCMAAQRAGRPMDKVRE